MMKDVTLDGPLDKTGPAEIFIKTNLVQHFDHPCWQADREGFSLLAKPWHVPPQRLE